ncbi:MULTISPECIES: serine hydrolase domain-containing protein [Clostridium]|uniref:Beta-lactamase family protein n=1 Tax=Clostridium senegalense TaxID=1465809 RepID=A0A6M0H408_9CLOT|nr:MULTISPECIES: serine hydrolase domain-containing protein [Clostridium]NEU05267.1 beta-lactamase family protein [Clostridium senegalense]
MNLQKQINELISDRVNKNQFSGAVLIKKGNEEIFSGAYGYANRTWRVNNSLQTRFRIASISKMFTAVSILQLIELEKVSFSTKVVEYLNLENSKISNDVTIESLLTHTSGIADYFDEEQDDDEWEKLWYDIPIYKMRRLEDYLELFIHKEPVSKINEKYHYNGAGYILLGLIIEKASGLSYFDYIRQNIFSKINMKNSDFISLDDVDDLVAEGYEAISDSNKKIIGWKKNIYTTTPNAASDGGATSTADDLIKFIEALRNNKLLSEKMSMEMFIPKVLEYDDTSRNYIWMYGYANEFILDEESKEIVRCGHTGEEYGVSCRLYYYPSTNVIVVILANQGWCAGSLGWDIHDVLMNVNS